jgi:hypothetical protein
MRLQVTVFVALFLLASYGYYTDDATVVAPLIATLGSCFTCALCIVSHRSCCRQKNYTLPTLRTDH